MADEVVIKISGDSKDAEKALKLVGDTATKVGKQIQEDLSRPVQSFSKELQGLSKSLNGIGLAAGGVFASISAFAYKSIAAFQEQDLAIKQLEQGLKNAGSTVGITSKQIQALASEIQSYSNFGDEAVLTSARFLVSIKNLGTDGFIRTQKAAVDLAAAMGIGLTGATRALGRALENPAEGLSALSRAGIRFSDEQKAVIKSLVDTGKTLEAQSFILDAVEKKYKGFAEAAANPFIQLKNDVGDVMEEFGKIFLESAKPIIQWLRDFAVALKDNKELIRVFADGLIVIGKAAALIIGAIGAIKVISGIAKGIEAISLATKVASVSMKTFVGATGIGILLILLPDIIDLLKDFWKWVEGPQIDIKNFKEVTKKFIDTGAELILAEENLKEAREKGYSEIDLKPLQDRILKLKGEYEEIKGIREGLAADIKAGKTVEGAPTKATTEEGGTVIDPAANVPAIQEKVAVESEAERQARLEEEAINAETAAEAQLLHEELGLEINAREIETIRAHIAAKRDLEMSGQQQYLKDLLTYGKTVADARKTFQSQELKDTAGTFENLNTLTKGGLKELSLLNKAFKIKDVIVDTAAAISKASASAPFPANIPAIAFAASTGAVQLATITSTGFAQGGMVSGGIPNIDSVPIMAQSGELVAPKRNFDEVVNAVADRRNAEAAGGTTPAGGISVVIQGNVYADSDEQIDRLIERINTAVEFRNTKLFGVT